jgi:hypothetical protein
VGEAIVYALVGVAVVVALIAVWRVALHDRTIRRVRFGVFYERDRDKDDD